MKDERIVSKWKAKLIFRGAWNNLMAWPDWLRPLPLNLRQIYATGRNNDSAIRPTQTKHRRSSVAVRRWSRRKHRHVFAAFVCNLRDLAQSPQPHSIKIQNWYITPSFRLSTRSVTWNRNNCYYLGYSVELWGSTSITDINNPPFNRENFPHFSALVFSGSWSWLLVGAGLVSDETRSSADADNRLDAFSGQSRSTNMVPFHMLHIVSYCAIVILSLRQITFLRYLSSKNFMTLKWGQRSVKVIESGIIR